MSTNLPFDDLNNGNSQVNASEVLSDHSKTKTPPSFKSFLTGETSHDEDIINILPDEVEYGQNELGPTVVFKERIQTQFEQNMKNAPIIRPLGHHMEYQSLLRNLHTDWKPKGEIKFVRETGNAVQLSAECNPQLFNGKKTRVTRGTTDFHGP